MNAPARPPVLFTHTTIANAILDLADRMSNTVGALDGEVTVLIVLKGAFRFAADLLAALPLDSRITRLEFITVRSYEERGLKGSLSVARLSAPEAALEGRHVIILDDIFDTGQTIKVIREYVARYNPASIREAVLIKRTDPHATVEPPTFHALTVAPGIWVWGYGLDYDGENCRTLGFIAGEDGPTP